MKRTHRHKFSTALDCYLPDDIGPIVPSQWVDINRPWRPADAPEGQLMLAILAQALIDYREGTILERRSAENWFARSGEGFEAICELLDINPGRVRQAIIKEK